MRDPLVLRLNLEKGILMLHGEGLGEDSGPIAWTTVRSIDELSEKARELLQRGLNKVREKENREVIKRWLGV